MPAALADEVFRSGGAWSVSLWVRLAPPTSSYDATFIWMDDPATVRGPLFYLENNGSVDFWIGDNSTWNNWPSCSPGTGLQDRWYHVAATFDGVKLRGYLDGTLVLTQTIGAFVLPAAGRPITLGLRPGTSPQSDLHGKMTDVRIYSGLLSSADIQLLHDYRGRYVSADAAEPRFFTPTASRAGTTNLVLVLPAVVGWQYQIEANEDLTTTNWVPIGPLLTAPPAGNQIQLTNSVASPGQRFYRMRMVY